MPNEKNASLRKRQQIENAGKVMFIWVAVAAAVVGIAVVVSISLFERISFNNEVLSKKNATASNLKHNNKVADELKDNIRVINTNQALADTPRNSETQPISVILDALPSNPNSSALGASLQQKLLKVDGVSIDLLTVNPISGVEDDDDDDESEGGEITFKFIASTNASQVSGLKQALLNLERSIRVIDLTAVTIEQQNNKSTLTAEGRAFYQPETKVELKTTTHKPGSKK